MHTKLIVLFSIFFSALVIPSTAVMARTDFMYTRQSGYDYCDGSSFYWCTNQIKDKNKRNAQSDLAFRCDMQRGKFDTWSVSCSEFCSPSWLAPDAQRQYVQCDSQCNGRCEIP